MSLPELKRLISHCLECKSNISVANTTILITEDLMFTTYLFHDDDDRANDLSHYSCYNSMESFVINNVTLVHEETLDDMESQDVCIGVGRFRDTINKDNMLELVRLEPERDETFQSDLDSIDVLYKIIRGQD